MKARGFVLEGAWMGVLWPDTRALIIIWVFIFAVSSGRFHERGY